MDCYVKTPPVMHPYSLAYEQFKPQVSLFALKKVIYPYDRYDSIMVLIRPLRVGLVDHANKHVDEIFFVTTVAQPSIHPQFAVMTLFEEAIID